MELKGKKATVIGLGREGIDLVRFLWQRGADITVSDAKTEDQLKGNIKKIEDLPLKLSLGANRVDDALGADVIFVSPGVPLDLPAIVAASQKGIPLNSLMRLFFQLCPARIVGITGSSGKSTTVSLLGEIFKIAERKVFVGGNIGEPLLGYLPEITADSWVILEISSFQLELMDKSPYVAAITNITPNHLDMHPSMEHYVAAKKRILQFQKPGDCAVLNYDDLITRQIAPECRSRVIFTSQYHQPPSDGVTVHHQNIVARFDGEEQNLLPIESIRLLGKHNIENVLIASATALACGIEADPIARAVSGFRGIEHRLEWVRCIGGADYYNDSIATSPERATAGLRSFDRPVILLAGGRDKHLPKETLAEEICKKCKSLVLFGEAASLLEQAVRDYQRTKSNRRDCPRIIRCRSLAETVQRAHSLASPGDVVLLSPACTSFDMFTDYEERGREFKRLVKELGGT